MTLQQWAMAAAFPFLSEKLRFEASLTWMKVFKQNHKIKQRKITKYEAKQTLLSSRKQKAAKRFRRQTRFLIHNFDLNKLVINTVANIRLLTIHQYIGSILTIHWTFKELKLYL